MVCGVREGVMAGTALDGSGNGWVLAHIWAGQEAKKRELGALCWLSLSVLLFWGEPHSGGVSLLGHTLTDTPSLLGDSKPSPLTVMGSSSHAICPH